MKPKITTHKYGGDDKYSWAVFVNDRPVVTGLSRREVPYYRDKVKRELQERRVNGKNQ